MYIIYEMLAAAAVDAPSFVRKGIKQFHSYIKNSQVKIL